MSTLVHPPPSPSRSNVFDALNAFGRRSPQHHEHQQAEDSGAHGIADEDELEEDDTFMGSAEVAAQPEDPATKSAEAVATEQELDEDLLEEDESFMVAGKTGYAATTDGTATLDGSWASSSSSTSARADAPATLDTSIDADLELEEDPSFHQPLAADSSHSFDAFGDDDSQEIPTYSQFARDALPANARVDMSRLDLGIRMAKNRSISGTAYNGQKVVFKRQKGNALVGEHASLGSGKGQSMGDKDPEELGKLAVGLLETPIHVLMERMAARERERQKAQAESSTSAQSSKPAQSPVKAVDKKGKGKEKEKMMIWTDRYKPKSFTELLGDERTHRQAMSWLKEWDRCVFKTEPNKKKSLKRAFGASENKENLSNIPQDPLRRPDEKILLLSGPPGLGKTTLAHVIASQAGYQTMEINASDDRSTKTVTDTIRNSLESRAITSKGTLSSGKPTCLIIDEIDGATGGSDTGFIRTLIKLVVDGSRISRGNANYAGKGKKKEAPPLVRPIICICNDLYTPALRPLRTMARIVRFHPPTSAMLIKRLRHICDGEGLKADSKSLTTLVEVAEGDMRSCLNTLQIVRSQTDVLEDKVIKSSALGLKDTSTSVLAVWNKIFKIQAKKRQKGIPDNSEGRYISPLVNLVSTCGEYDKIAQSCFESYLTTKSPADGLQATNRALDWLGFYDRLDARLRSERDYDIMPYMPYAFVAWHPLFGAVQSKSPDWPRIDYEMYTKRLAHQEIADALKRTLPLALKSCYSSSLTIATELSPLLVRIISPDLKPVNQQIVKSEERQALTKLVKIMTDLGISYVQDRNEEGQIVYKLEPQLEAFVYWEGKKANDVPAPRFNLRQLVSKELETEALRRAGGAEAASTSSGSKGVKDIMNAYKSNEQKAKEGQVGATAAAVDFFGRPLAVKVTLDEAGEEVAVVQPPAKKAKIAYKFHEGFSNAVRMNVKVSELFR